MAEREALIGLLERVSGNRVHYGVNAIGGVRRDLTPERAADILAVLGRLESLAHFVVDALGEHGALGAKIAGQGIVTGPEAIDLGAVGPTLRGSGIESDLRKEEGYAAYPAVTFDVIVETGGDVRARFMVRARETLESIRIIRQLFDRLPDGPLDGRGARSPISRNRGRSWGESKHRAESWSISCDPTARPFPIGSRSARPPSPTSPSCAGRSRESRSTSTRTIIESIDPCLSCTDR